jgi:hypothetical protein
MTPEACDERVGEVLKGRGHDEEHHEDAHEDEADHADDEDHDE